MEESRKHIAQDDLFIPELKKRVINYNVGTIDTLSEWKEKPCVIELGVLPDSDDLMESKFKLTKKNDKLVCTSQG